MSSPAERPIIRNLESLKQDMTGELRLILDEIYQYRKDVTPATRDRLVTITEIRVRTVLEYLTGSRE